MPELPDITIYIEALEKRILGQRLEGVRIVSPFLLRSVEPPVASAIGKNVVELRRVGKRICIGLGEGGRSEDGRLRKAGPTTTTGVEGYLEQKRPPQKAAATTGAEGHVEQNSPLQKAGLQDGIAGNGKQEGPEQEEPTRKLAPTTEWATAEKGGAGPYRVNKSAYATEEAEIWLVLHLMIAGRLHWKEGPPRKAAATGSANKGAKLSKQHLAAFDFANGSLLWTEAGSQKRASLHLARGEAGLAELDPGGLEILRATLPQFSKVLTSENHTLKRALTDPEWFSGIGNAYSDEILWSAKLSPLLQTQKMKEEEIRRLFEATRESLTEWTARLRAETGETFPEKVTAFRPEMAVHGKYKQACPRCGGKVQRIKYASNETNYCPTCQTGGKLLADRAISRLLREDWPKTPEEMEMRLGRYRSSKL
ncbi:MAG TPA: DNA-formamidopyrimidine glycosylase family protein [Candidatus Acidoferrum sp.]|nr:DNA-formamidopyrimidine glycosylase family protein [Candidatus Acidoferrum sp.]